MECNPAQNAHGTRQIFNHVSAAMVARKLSGSMNKIRFACDAPGAHAGAILASVFPTSFFPLNALRKAPPGFRN
jgi:hypothetical protein